jgi:hypothetical protein
MELVKVLFVSLLIVVWWIGSWGLIELVVQSLTRGSMKNAVLVYSFMILFVITIVYFNPTILEHFV